MFEFEFGHLNEDLEKLSIPELETEVRRDHIMKCDDLDGGGQLHLDLLRCPAVALDASVFLQAPAAEAVSSALSSTTKYDIDKAIKPSSGIGIL